jgi:hypothetical protein
MKQLAVLLAWWFLTTYNTGPGFRVQVVGPFDSEQDCHELAEWTTRATEAYRQPSPKTGGMRRYNVSRCWSGSDGRSHAPLP